MVGHNPFLGEPNQHTGGAKKINLVRPENPSQADRESAPNAGVESSLLASDTMNQVATMSLRQIRLMVFINQIDSYETIIFASK